MRSRTRHALRMRPTALLLLICTGLGTTDAYLVPSRRKILRNDTNIHDVPAVLAGNAAPDEEAHECNPREQLDPCEHIHLTPECSYERLNYLEFHYCTLPKYSLPPSVSAVLFTIWLLYLFSFIGQAADGFFAPAVANISDRLRLPPDVAGATLLAFGNGAADFFTQIAAITHGTVVDLPLALGESVGAGVYVCSACLAVVVILSPTKVVVDSGPFTRDGIAYLIALSLCAGAITDSNFELHEALFMVLWYGMYIVVVMFGPQLFPNAFELPSDKPEQSDLAPSPQKAAAGEAAPSRPSLDSIKRKDSGQELCDQAEGGEPQRNSSDSTSPKRRAAPTSPQPGGGGRDMEAAASEDAVTSDGAPGHAECDTSLDWVRGQMDWASMDLQGRLCFAFSAPVSALVALTMPPMECRILPKKHALVISVVAPTFVYWTFVADPHGSTAGDVVKMLITALACAATTQVTCPEEGMACGASMVSCSVAFVVGIAWMQLCAAEIVNIFQLLGRVLGLPEAFLGGTILAIGASSGDLASLMATARAGHAKMAVSACFAGPLFQLLLGTGVSLLYVCYLRGNVLMEIHGNLPAMFICAFVLLLYHCFVVTFVHNFHLSRTLAACLGVYYVGYLGVMSLTGFGYIG